MTPSQRVALVGALGYLRNARRALRGGDVAWAVSSLADTETFLGMFVGLDIVSPAPHLPSIYGRVRRLADVFRADLVRAVVALAEPDAEQLTASITEMILVLRSRDGVEITDEQAAERARNVVCLVVLTRTHSAMGGRREPFPARAIEGAA